jgi:hypothetical protein
MRTPCVQEKVFQHEPALSALQRGVAAKASKLAIDRDSITLNAHNLIACTTVWALEPRNLRCRHNELHS